MKVTLEIPASDIRNLILKRLQQDYPESVIRCFGANDFQIQTTYRANEKWRRPTAIRFIVEREDSL